jgi:hypothetical protein
MSVYLLATAKQNAKNANDTKVVPEDLEEEKAEEDGGSIEDGPASMSLSAPLRPRSPSPLGPGEIEGAANSDQGATAVDNGEDPSKVGTLKLWDGNTEEPRRHSVVATLEEFSTELEENAGINKEGTPNKNLMRRYYITAVVPLLQFVGYILAGYFFYSNMETDDTGKPWTFIDCMYFAIVTCTSVGYGDLTPTSDGSKMFTCIYALVGIGFVGELLMKVVGVIYRIQQALRHRATLVLLKRSLQMKKLAQEQAHKAMELAERAALDAEVCTHAVWYMRWMQRYVRMLYGICVGCGVMYACCMVYALDAEVCTLTIIKQNNPNQTN